MAAVGGNYVLNDGLIANEAITAKRFVKQVAAAEKHIDMADTQGERVLGVSVDMATAGDATNGRVVNVALLGIAVVEAGAAVARGALLMTNATGQAITATATNRVVGYALSSAANAGEWIQIILAGPGAQFVAA